MKCACAISSSFISSLSGSTIFFHIFLQTACFSKKKLLNIKCVIWFSIQFLSETFLSIRRMQRDVVIHVHRFSFKVILFLLGLYKTWIFSTGIRKILQCEISWKSFQREPSCFMRADGRAGRQRDRQLHRWTDMKKLLVTFRNFVNAPNKDI